MASANIQARINNELHATNCFKELHSLWQYGQLCDLTLKVGRFEFKVHKVILVSCSQYFKNMFTEELFIERERNYVELHQIDVDAFRSILEYFYSGYITLTENNLEQVFRTADFFSLTALKSLCRESEYLLENISVNNCVRRYCLADLFGFERLKSRTKTFIMEQLDEVSKTHEFRSINQETLKEILSSNKGNSKAEPLYNAIMQWLRHDLDNRKSLLSSLLVLIPTEGITYDFYIDKMKNNQILRENFICTSWLLDNFIERFAKTNVGASIPETNVFATSLVGNNPICYMCKLQSNELVILPPRPAIIRFSAVYYQKHIYLTAGELDDKNLQKSYKYNTYERKWSEIDINFERCNAGSCILRDQLYVIGGFDYRDNYGQKSCMYYDFNYERCFPMRGMKERRLLPGVGVFENSIYACCGVSKFNELSCIKRYDPREGLWFDVGNYKVAKGCCSSTVISESLYSSILESGVVERFDFRNNDSEELTKPINNGWITSTNGRLFKMERDDLSEYDHDNNQWLTKERLFNLRQPIILSLDST